MGAIKHFFHDEICAMQEGENLHIDDAYMYAKWQAEQTLVGEFEEKQEADLEEDLFIDETFNKIQEDLDNSELPSWMHPKLG